MRNVFTRLAVLGGAVGAALFLRRYLSGSGQRTTTGDVEITLEDGSTVTPDPTTTRELTETAARVLEVGERA